jgi:hypothetical protein
VVDAVLVDSFLLSPNREFYLHRKLTLSYISITLLQQMNFDELRSRMLESATSCMTKHPGNRKMVLADIGSGGLLTIKDDADNSFLFNDDGSIEDQESEITVEQLKQSYTSVDLYFSYSFGGGQPTFVKSKNGNGFTQAKPKKTIRDWTSAFPNGDCKAWEKAVIEILTGLDPRFTTASIDYDGDFGYQGVILTISK